MKIPKSEWYLYYPGNIPPGSKLQVCKLQVLGYLETDYIGTCNLSTCNLSLPLFVQKRKNYEQEC